MFLFVDKVNKILKVCYVVWLREEAGVDKRQRDIPPPVDEGCIVHERVGLFADGVGVDGIGVGKDMDVHENEQSCCYRRRAREL